MKQIHTWILVNRTNGLVVAHTKRGLPRLFPSEDTALEYCYRRILLETVYPLRATLQWAAK